MRESSNLDTASNLDNHLIGYERLLALFKSIQKQTPKGVGLKREVRVSATYVALQFKIGDKRTSKACNCPFTEIGIIQSLEKAQLVSQALEKFTSEIEFWQWYEEVILESNVVKNDLITFAEAIQLVENNYWSSCNGKRQPRNRSNPSHQSCWNDAYGRYFKLLPLENTVNYSDILTAINSKETGTKMFSMCVRAMRKLTELCNYQSIYQEIQKIKSTQFKFRDDLQSVAIEDFLEMRECILDVPPNDKRYNIESRKSWLFVFSMQVVYGLRISEVFAVKNINTPFITKDGITISALNEPNNEKMIAVVGNETIIGTTTKTGYRLTIPLIPPTHPDLIETLNIKEGVLPQVTLETTNPTSIRHKYTKTARNHLCNWLKDTKFTQTHALRHLANLNGMMAGVSLEKRAMSLGHSPTMNDQVYKKRQTTKTTIDLLTQSNHQALPLQTAIAIAKQLGCIDKKSVTLLSSIYNVSEGEIIKLLNIN
ncbi:MAG: site-specific integrase [Aphanizomenon flos-aquae KM1D3_PB]|uniref:site-specific integrase n=1 Tax=Aphanizomenon flos-aquae TaxID=1176 RepID=UPI0005436668|nr:site-specific integrase [Aphanizomenon flos-aquae]KHG41955.1 hypothetical protein OA07_08165 [Aphanizomenon flos-aquae 2012/KM1/D3]QSV70079.1 MAG: site-specific integrase [Aphanizomenon flos-aquae KM1D3_PB]